MFAAFGFGGGGSTFSSTYRVYPVSFLEKESAERGDKLILPPSALDRLGEEKFSSFNACSFPFFCLALQSLPLFELESNDIMNRIDKLFILEEEKRGKKREKRTKENRSPPSSHHASLYFSLSTPTSFSF